MSGTPLASERKNSPAGGDAPRLDVERVRAEFPILARQVHGKPLAYLDNAATTQKPQRVIDRLTQYYTRENANIHRGVHLLSQEATRAYEDARARVGRFLGATASEEVIFLRGTTEAVNLVAQSCCQPRLREGDEIVLSGMEHHSNIVPWQMVCEATGAVLRIAPVDERGALDLDGFRELLGPRTRFVAIVHVSNALGTVNPVAAMVDAVRGLPHRVPVLVDGAQAVAHLPVDVAELGCDFYAFSGHKIFGPTGIGCLWGRRELLEEMPPWQGGGDMILSVSFEKTTYNRVPHKFEAGTPHIAGVLGLAEALDWVDDTGLDAIAQREEELLAYATPRLEGIEGLRIVGTAPGKTGILSFVFEDIHPHDIGTILDHEGVAVRAGHHCAQPLMDRFGVAATVRASLAPYNTEQEIDRLADGLHRVRELFG